MNPIKPILNFFTNLYLLIKASAKNEKVHWEILGSNLINCDIHPKARVFKYHVLSNTKVDLGSYISLNARIYNTTIGKFCSIGPNLVAGWGLHPINGISTSPVFYSTSCQVGFTYCRETKVKELIPITIGNDVFIGANVTILDGVTIGDGAVIGAGAVVSKDIPPYAVAVGCPIKIVKYRFDEKTIQGLLASKWWEKDEATLKNVEEMFFDVEKFLTRVAESTENKVK
ncbi:Acetyltransferase (isoleucine patch superfamily) [Cyclobacterium lianum]|uniref:Acetyltransferase (Isoleucine patch superfamily) n=1 Tax=Cyclobacterium lianum TaxID=388280 RepID=A0A1M7NIC2_9BACT|nr:CatB-related O-acetyltransferase [Cyclobacterium lianum]SHN02993.1 Acetyltransferase (isoleucine patch superfamily) [Cyclobacterium lianum]